MLNTFNVLTMLKAINTSPRPRTFLRDLLFAGRVQTFPTEEVLVDLVKGKRRLAPFVSSYVGGKLMEREGFRTEKYRTPLVQPRDIITPERIKQRQAGESVISAVSPAERAAMEQAGILNGFDISITRREEWMVSQLIYTGGIHMVGEGYDEQFSVNFTNTEVLSGTNLWSNAASNPIGDLGRWRLAVMQKTGITPTAVVMGDDVATAFLNNPTVQAELNRWWMQMGQIKPEVKENGQTFLGHLNRENLDLYSYSEWFVDDSTQNLMPMVPAGKVALVPEAANNPGAMMLYGAYTEMDEGKTYEGARIPRVWSEKGPNIQIVEVVARPLPTMVDSDCWFVGTVL